MKPGGVLRYKPLEKFGVEAVNVMHQLKEVILGISQAQIDRNIAQVRMLVDEKSFGPALSREGGDAGGKGCDPRTTLHAQKGVQLSLLYRRALFSLFLFEFDQRFDYAFAQRAVS